MIFCHLHLALKVLSYLEILLEFCMRFTSPIITQVEWVSLKQFSSVVEKAGQ